MAASASPSSIPSHRAAVHATDGATPDRVVIPCDADWSRAEQRALRVPRADVRGVRVVKGGALAEIYTEVRSQSRPDLWHAVRPEAGGWSCDCEAGTHGRPCLHVAAAQPPCVNCRTDRSRVNSDLCAGCEAVLADRLAAEIPAPIPFPAIRRTGTAARLEQAQRALDADLRWQAAERAALDHAATFRPLGR